MERPSRLVLLAACLCLLTQGSGLAQSAKAGPLPGGLTPETQKRLIDSLNKAEAYLKQQQPADGIWEKNPGIAALAATAILKQPGAVRATQLTTVGKTLDALAALAKPDGGIYVNIIPHYITAVSTVALIAGGRPADRPIIERARAYLADNLLDEGEGVSQRDFWYGGMGYGGTARVGQRQADMISLEYALRAMKDADLPGNNAAWQKALTFLQRTQNNSETNDQKWAGNDGGFVYYPGFSYHVDGGTQSYGSVSYAGLLSYTYANLRKEDQRVKAAVKWISDHYTVDENPGLGQKTVYYYYMVFAKALSAIDQATIVDARGRSHNWREELGRKLISLQHSEGFWVNTVPDELQDNKVLVTAFTMSAIQALLQ